MTSVTSENSTVQMLLWNNGFPTQNRSNFKIYHKKNNTFLFLMYEMLHKKNKKSCFFKFWK